jgi:hypothetical protein
MKAETSFVRADGAIHLDPKAPVHLDLTAVISPGNTEGDRALWLRHPLEDLRVLVTAILRKQRLQARVDIADGLNELLFARIFRLDLFDHALDVAHLAIVPTM